MIQSSARRAELALLMVAVMWGLSFPLIKVSLEYLPPFTFLAARFVLGAVLFTAATRWGLPSRAAVRPGILLGLLLAVSYAAQTWGLQYTTATRSAFVTGLNVVMVPFLYPVLTRLLPGKAPVFGALVAVLGLWLLTQPGGQGINRGDAATLICALGYALYVIVLEVVTQKQDYRPVLQVQMWVLPLCFLLPAAGEAGGIAGLNLEAGLCIAAAAVLLLVTMGLQNHFQKDTTATKASVIFASEPVFAAVFAFLMFGEVLAGLQWLGAALIIAAIVISELRWTRSG